MGMFERYSMRARRTIYHARYEALRRRSIEIEPKDIIVGLTWDAHKSSCPFAMLHENADELRTLVGSDQTIYGPPNKRDIPLSNDSKRALAYADREAKLDRRYTIGSDHLLRGVLRNGDETAAKLINAGYTLSAMRQASKQAHRSNPETAPFLWQVSLYRRKFALATALILFIVVILYLRSKN
jgi:ATP-dependent Clp protease ATP-binding subunit ClpA